MKRSKTMELTSILKGKLEENKLLKSLVCIDEEYIVHGSFSGELGRHGRIDYILQYNDSGVRYLTEVWLGDNFWGCLKILGYRAAYLIQNSLYCDKARAIKCMVILTDKIYHPNIRNILAFLDIYYLFVDKKGKVVRQSIDERLNIHT